MGIITPEDASCFVDHKKISRAKERVCATLTQQFQLGLSENKVQCIMFDGRKDLTKFLVKDEFVHKGQIKEEHISLCDANGEYLFHFTPTTGPKEKPAHNIAQHIFDWLQKNSMTQSLLAVGCDSTNLNTGYAGGVIQFLEKKLQRRLNWLICQLHTNELPLRHLVSHLDGRTVSNNCWSGVLGNNLNDVTSLPTNDYFPKISAGPDLPHIPSDILQDMSTDQLYGYKIVSAIR